MNKLTLELGHPIQNNVQKLTEDCVRFVAEDGRTMFEVRSRTGSSIEIRGVEMCKFEGTLHDYKLMIEPECSNSIIIHTTPYPH